MTPKQFCMLVFVSAASAFAGGLLGSRLFLAPTALAQSGRVKLIEAEEFRLVEKDGKPCGRFQVDKNGRPGVFLFDKHGEVRAVLGVLPNGSPHLALSDRRGEVRVTLAIFSDERSALVLSDGDRTPRVSLTVQSDGAPSLGLSDREGKTRAVFGVAPADLTRVRHRSESSVALLDQEGKVLWSAP